MSILVGVQIESKGRNVAVQCDLQNDTSFLLMKDASTQTVQQHHPLHSSPILLPNSESEISDFEDHHLKDTSYCAFSPSSHSS